jgi:hypothetical protein
MDEDWTDDDWPDDDWPDEDWVDEDWVDEDCLGSAACADSGSPAAAPAVPSTVAITRAAAQAIRPMTASISPQKRTFIAFMDTWCQLSPARLLVLVWPCSSRK